MSWADLCRFCAAEHEQELDIKNSHIENFPEVIIKLFTFSDIENLNVFKVCTECYIFLNSICKFYSQAKKISKMFLQIESSIQANIPVDAAQLNLKYGVNVEIIGACCDDLKNSIDKNQEIAITNPPSNSKESQKKRYKNVNVKTVKNEKPNSSEEEDLDKDFNDSFIKENKIKDPLSMHSESFTKPKQANSIKSLKKNIQFLKQMRIYKCEMCNIEFEREGNCTTHKKKMHGIVEKIEPCETCGKKFSNKGALREHLKLHLSVEEKELHYLKCPHCDNKYPKRSQMLSHINSIHSIERSFICEICGKAYTSQNNLYSHKKAAHETIDTACPICQKIFKTASRMRNHAKSHREPSIPCDVCGTLFKSNANLKSHMQIHSDF